MTEVIKYYYRGQIEHGKNYRWANGFSATNENGNNLYPWMTRRECQQDARKQGKRAVFVND